MAHNASASSTGGIIKNLLPLSKLKQKLASVMEGSGFIEGDQQLSAALTIPKEPEGQLPQSSAVTEVQINDNSLCSTSQTINYLGSQQSAPSTLKHSPHTRRLRRLQRSQLKTERQRFIRLEKKRMEAAVAHADGWRNLVLSIDNLANAITIGANKIAQALQNTRN